MKKRILGLFIILLVAVVSYWGTQRYSKTSSHDLEVSGTIEATEINLNAKVPGILETLSVNSGDAVKKGHLVASLGRNDLIAQKERDALGVFKAEAQLADLLSGARGQEIRDARAQVNAAQAAYEKTNSDYLRSLELHKNQALSDAELEKAETQWKVAKNQLESAEAKLSLLESGTRPEQINAAKIEVEKSKAILKASRALVEDTKLFSPIDGTVISKNYEPGEYVQAGSPVITVADLNDLWIKVFVPTDYLPRIKLGQKVRFTVSGLTDSFTGTIVEIATKGEFTPKTIQTKQERTNIVYGVKIKIENQNGLFKPGMPADVIIRD